MMDGLTCDLQVRAVYFYRQSAVPEWTYMHTTHTHRGPTCFEIAPTWYFIMGSGCYMPTMALVTPPASLGELNIEFNYFNFRRVRVSISPSCACSFTPLNTGHKQAYSADNYSRRKAES